MSSVSASFTRAFAVGWRRRRPGSRRGRRRTQELLPDDPRPRRAWRSSVGGRGSPSGRGGPATGGTIDVVPDDHPAAARPSSSPAWPARGGWASAVCRRVDGDQDVLDPMASASPPPRRHARGARWRCRTAQRRASAPRVSRPRASSGRCGCGRGSSPRCTRVLRVRLPTTEEITSTRLAEDRRRPTPEESGDEDRQRATDSRST